eukprot:TRINITY_DN4053_c0_g3_i2.p1 TRINITY_DN4053_c0_g3~~TRINITY_DN4053_c0_g3_i2.p1  ORF type:complete len:4157 (+),score=963.60 TRINITY_DN4053_c0_g3_i2:186-12656(+)
MAWKSLIEKLPTARPDKVLEVDLSDNLHLLYGGTLDRGRRSRSGADTNDDGELEFAELVKWQTELIENLSRDLGRTQQVIAEGTEEAQHFGVIIESSLATDLQLSLSFACHGIFSELTEDDELSEEFAESDELTAALALMDFLTASPGSGAGFTASRSLQLEVDQEAKRIVALKLRAHFGLHHADCLKRVPALRAANMPVLGDSIKDAIGDLQGCNLSGPASMLEEAKPLLRCIWQCLTQGKEVASEMSPPISGPRVPQLFQALGYNQAKDPASLVKMLSRVLPSPVTTKEGITSLAFELYECIVQAVLKAVAQHWATKTHAACSRDSQTKKLTVVEVPPCCPLKFSKNPRKGRPPGAAKEGESAAYYMQGSASEALHVFQREKLLELNHRRQSHGADLASQERDRLLKKIDTHEEEHATRCDWAQWSRQVRSEALRAEKLARYPGASEPKAWEWENLAYECDCRMWREHCLRRAVALKAVAADDGRSPTREEVLATLRDCDKTFSIKMVAAFEPASDGAPGELLPLEPQFSALRCQLPEDVKAAFQRQAVVEQPRQPQHNVNVLPPPPPAAAAQAPQAREPPVWEDAVSNAPSPQRRWTVGALPEPPPAVAEDEIGIGSVTLPTLFRRPGGGGGGGGGGGEDPPAAKKPEMPEWGRQVALAEQEQPAEEGHVDVWHGGFAGHSLADLNRGLPFVEDNFPEEDLASIVCTTSSGLRPSEFSRMPIVEWLSATRIRKLALMADGVDSTGTMNVCGDADPRIVLRGLPGASWIVGGLAALQEFDTPIKDVFKKHVSLRGSEAYDGLYELELFDPSSAFRKTTVKVSDRIPCVRRADHFWQPCFTSTLQPELWPMLLEKSIAKLLGGYAALDRKRATLALAMLTGETVYRVLFPWPAGEEPFGADDELRYATTKRARHGLWWGEGEFGALHEDGCAYKFRRAADNCFGAERIWERLRCAEEDGKLMMCTFKMAPAAAEAADGLSELDKRSPQSGRAPVTGGLLEGHDYPILSVARVGERLLLQLKNPWGARGEWRGAWSNESGEWSQQADVAEELKYHAGMHTAAGVFWMSWEDFRERVFDITISDASFTTRFGAMASKKRLPSLSSQAQSLSPVPQVETAVGVNWPDFWHNLDIREPDTLQDDLSSWPDAFPRGALSGSILPEAAQANGVRWLSASRLRKLLHVSGEAATLLHQVRERLSSEGWDLSSSDVQLCHTVDSRVAAAVPGTLGGLVTAAIAPVVHLRWPVQDVFVRCPEAPLKGIDGPYALTLHDPSKGFKRVTIRLNDQIPCFARFGNEMRRPAGWRPCFTGAITPDMWPMLLEKGFASLAGGYDALRHCNVAQLWAMVLGQTSFGVIFRWSTAASEGGDANEPWGVGSFDLLKNLGDFSFEPRARNGNSSQWLWDRLHLLTAERRLLACTFKKEEPLGADVQSDEEDEDTKHGLLSEHVYTLLTVRCVMETTRAAGSRRTATRKPREHRFVLLRSPWPQDDYNWWGSWARGSALWSEHPQVSADLVNFAGIELAGDAAATNTFWMPYEDFVQRARDILFTEVALPAAETFPVRANMQKTMDEHEPRGGKRSPDGSGGGDASPSPAFGSPSALQHIAYQDKDRDFDASGRQHPGLPESLCDVVVPTARAPVCKEDVVTDFPWSQEAIMKDEPLLNTASPLLLGADLENLMSDGELQSELTEKLAALDNLNRLLNGTAAAMKTEAALPDTMWTATPHELTSPPPPPPAVSFFLPSATATSGLPAVPTVLPAAPLQLPLPPAGLPATPSVSYTQLPVDASSAGRNPSFSLETSPQGRAAGRTPKEGIDVPAEQPQQQQQQQQAFDAEVQPGNETGRMSTGRDTSGRLPPPPAPGAGVGDIYEEARGGTGATEQSPSPNVSAGPAPSPPRSGSSDGGGRQPNPNFQDAARAARTVYPDRAAGAVHQPQYDPGTGRPVQGPADNGFSHASAEPPIPSSYADAGDQGPSMQQYPSTAATVGAQDVGGRRSSLMSAMRTRRSSLRGSRASIDSTAGPSGVRRSTRVSFNADCFASDEDGSEICDLNRGSGSDSSSAPISESQMQAGSEVLTGELCIEARDTLALAPRVEQRITDLKGDLSRAILLTTGFPGKQVELGHPQAVGFGGVFSIVVRLHTLRIMDVTHITRNDVKNRFVSHFVDKFKVAQVDDPNAPRLFKLFRLKHWIHQENRKASLYGNLAGAPLGPPTMPSSSRRSQFAVYATPQQQQLGMRSDLAASHTVATQEQKKPADDDRLVVQCHLEYLAARNKGWLMQDIVQPLLRDAIQQRMRPLYGTDFDVTDVCMCCLPKQKRQNMRGVDASNAGTIHFAVTFSSTAHSTFKLLRELQCSLLAFLDPGDEPGMALPKLFDRIDFDKSKMLVSSSLYPKDALMDPRLVGTVLPAVVHARCRIKREGSSTYAKFSPAVVSLARKVEEELETRLGTPREDFAGRVHIQKVGQDPSDPDCILLDIEVHPHGKFACLLHVRSALAQGFDFAKRLELGAAEGSSFSLMAEEDLWPDSGVLCAHVDAKVADGELIDARMSVYEELFKALFSSLAKRLKMESWLEVRSCSARLSQNAPKGQRRLTFDFEVEVEDDAQTRQFQDYCRILTSDAFKAVAKKEKDAGNRFFHEGLSFMTGVRLCATKGCETASMSTLSSSSNMTVVGTLDVIDRHQLVDDAGPHHLARLVARALHVATGIRLAFITVLFVKPFFRLLGSPSATTTASSRDSKRYLVGFELRLQHQHEQPSVEKLLRVYRGFWELHAQAHNERCLALSPFHSDFTLEAFAEVWDSPALQTVLTPLHRQELESNLQEFAPCLHAHVDFVDANKRKPAFVYGHREHRRQVVEAFREALEKGLGMQDQKDRVVVTCLRVKYSHVPVVDELLHPMLAYKCQSEMHWDPQARMQRPHGLPAVGAIDFHSVLQERSEPSEPPKRPPGYTLEFQVTPAPACNAEEGRRYLEEVASKLRCLASAAISLRTGGLRFFKDFVMDTGTQIGVADEDGASFFHEENHIYPEADDCITLVPSIMELSSSSADEPVVFNAHLDIVDRPMRICVSDADAEHEIRDSFVEALHEHLKEDSGGFLRSRLVKAPDPKSHSFSQDIKTIIPNIEKEHQEMYKGYLGLCLEHRAEGPHAGLGSGQSTPLYLVVTGIRSKTAHTTAPQAGYLKHNEFGHASVQLAHDRKAYRIDLQLRRLRLPEDAEDSESSRRVAALVSCLLRSFARRAAEAADRFSYHGRGRHFFNEFDVDVGVQVDAISSSKGERSLCPARIHAEIVLDAKDHSAASAWTGDRQTAFQKAISFALGAQTSQVTDIVACPWSNGCVRVRFVVKTLAHRPAREEVQTLKARLVAMDNHTRSSSRLWCRMLGGDRASRVDFWMGAGHLDWPPCRLAQCGVEDEDDGAARKGAGGGVWQPPRAAPPPTPPQSVPRSFVEQAPQSPPQSVHQPLGQSHAKSQSRQQTPSAMQQRESVASQGGGALQAARLTRPPDETVSLRYVWDVKEQGVPSELQLDSLTLKDMCHILVRCYKDSEKIKDKGMPYRLSLLRHINYRCSEQPMSGRILLSTHDRKDIYEPWHVIWTCLRQIKTAASMKTEGWMMLVAQCLGERGPRNNGWTQFHEMVEALRLLEVFCAKQSEQSDPFHPICGAVSVDEFPENLQSVDDLRSTFLETVRDRPGVPAIAFSGQAWLGHVICRLCTEINYMKGSDDTRFLRANDFMVLLHRLTMALYRTIWNTLQDLHPPEEDPQGDEEIGLYLKEPWIAFKEMLLLVLKTVSEVITQAQRVRLDPNEDKSQDKSQVTMVCDSRFLRTSDKAKGIRQYYRLDTASPWHRADFQDDSESAPFQDHVTRWGEVVSGKLYKVQGVLCLRHSNRAATPIYEIMRDGSMVQVLFAEAPAGGASLRISGTRNVVPGRKFDCVGMHNFRPMFKCQTADCWLWAHKVEPEEEDSEVRWVLTNLRERLQSTAGQLDPWKIFLRSEPGDFGSPLVAKGWEILDATGKMVPDPDVTVEPDGNSTKSPEPDNSAKQYALAEMLHAATNTVRLFMKSYTTRTGRGFVKALNDSEVVDSVEFLLDILDIMRSLGAEYESQSPVAIAVRATGENLRVLAKKSNYERMVARLPEDKAIDPDLSFNEIEADLRRQQEASLQRLREQSMQRKTM